MRALPLLLCALVLPAQSVEWRRTYGQPRYACGPGTAAIDASGTLWVLCDGTNYANRSRLTTLYSINGSTGDPIDSRELPQPAPTANWPVERKLVPTGATVSLLSSMLNPRSGKIQYAEGVTLTLFQPPNERTITAKTERLAVAIPGPDGSFFLATDQEPLVIRHLDPQGAPLWTRRFTSDLVLPTLAAWPNGALCATAQTGSGLNLLRLSPTGAITHQTPIAAEQGAVATGPAGVCALLTSDATHAVTLSAYSPANQLQWKTATPLTAPSGPSYSLHALPSAYLAINERLIAKYTHSGQLEWSTPLPGHRGFGSIVVTATSVYLIEGLAPNLSFTVTKIRL